MITCKRCGAVYADDAIYCNRCQSDLDNESAANLFDQQEMAGLQQAQRLARKQVATILFLIGLLFPFLVWFDLVYFAATFTQQVSVTAIVEFAVLSAVIAVWKNWRPARLICRVTGGLLLPLFPAGTFLAALLLYQLVKRDWW